MEIAQTSQERRDILERSMIGGALSEDDDSQSFTDSQSEISSTGIPFDIPDDMNGFMILRVGQDAYNCNGNYG